ncbi:autotransporter serine protease fusolisin [Fusobacterium canifelinum]|uniref:Autotransporter serine protease fusolisin n=1 Tax=Fusobacterium canifelinum TaxID=285729 RepID=A0A7T4KGQ8_9FUSO|nr:autotransporter serine protease fusolisin [Fusobacterium canifelinum]QQB73882.1 autotransporter serine protease fusolisin [Fusobacterium canifelinum]
MKKEILKSKVILLTLASILFVSCGGGGGGGGGSSNLPINPHKTPATPSIPGNPSIENTFPTVNNPLDEQKKLLGMKALKEKLEREWNDRERNVQIPSDTRKIEGSTQKIAILSTDFLNNHDYNDHFDNDPLTTKYPGIEIVPRTDSKNSIADDGEKELEMLIGRGEGTHFPITYSNKTKLKPIVASIGTGGSDKNDISTELSLKAYRDVLNRFVNQKVKVFYQMSDTDTTIKTSGYTNQTIRNLTFRGDEKKSENAVIPFYKDVVNNKGGLFIWSAGDTDENDKEMNEAELYAGLPYFDKELEKGWIAVVGVYGYGAIKNKHLDNPHYAYPGDVAKYWAISAESSSMMFPNKNNSNTSSTDLSSRFAAVKVARTAALVAEKFDWMTADQIRQTLFTTTDETEKKGDALGRVERRIELTPDNKYGWGMLNEKRALKGPGAFMNITSDPNASSYFYANIPTGKVSYFDNQIFGRGGLVKSGGGTLHLTQNNSYAGGSIVNGGTLEIHQVHASPVSVNKNGTLVLHTQSIIGYDETGGNKSLEGTDTLATLISAEDITTTGVKLRNLGKVVVNGTTAIIGGDYVGYKGSTLVFNNGAKLNVLGKIRVEDSTVKVMSNEYITNESKIFNLMEASSIEGNIAKVETNGMRKANVEVKDGKVVATLSRQNPVEYIGEKAEASSKNVAENVEKVFQDLDQKVLSGTATKEELTMGSTLQNMTTTGFVSATEMMSGEVYASAQALTFSQAQNVNRDLSNRLAGLDNFKNSNKDSEVWFSVLGSAGKLRREGYASADTRVTGGQFGIDTKFEGTTTLGVALNYSYAKANFNRYAGESKSNMVGVSFYGKQELPYGFYTAGRLGLSNVSSKVERELLTSTGETLTGKINHHDKMLSAYVEIGKKIGWFTPFIGYSQDYLRRGSFNESEASWGIKADSKNYRATNFLVGARAEYVGDKYKLQAYVTQAINTDKRDLTYEGNFTGSNVRQKFQGVKQAKNTTWIGFGVFREISPVFGVYGNVDFRVEDKKWADSIISTGLQYRF